jgi:hypothetical protein
MLDVLVEAILAKRNLHPARLLFTSYFYFRPSLAT